MPNGSYTRIRPRVPAICEWCAHPFMALPYDVNVGKGRFCSRSCSSRVGARRPLEGRFWAKVNRCGPIPANNPEFGPCWLWTASTNGRGYGQFMAGPGARKIAPRLALEMALGRLLANDEFACHTCDVPACVRNDASDIYTVNGVAYPRFGHLWLGDKYTNAADMAAKQRSQQGSRHWGAKLSESDIQDIVALLKSGATGTAVAMRYGVSGTTISRIRLGQSWRHLLTP